MDGDVVQEGPWRATRLWNSIVRSLHDGMPLKKHRKNLKTHEDCFTANEAIEWLHGQLKKNPNFDADVSKDQTLMLLQKLLRAGVILRIDDDVSLSRTTTSAMLSSAVDTFKPGGELFRLAPRTEALLNTPGKSKTNSQKRFSNRVRSPLGDIGNTPLGNSQFSQESVTEHSSPQHTHKFSGFRKSFRKIKNKHRELLFRNDYTTDDDDGNHENQLHESPSGDIDVTQRKNMNLSYLQSLPANSLVVLGSDSTWREVYLKLLRQRLSDAHVNSLYHLIDVRNIIYNMTKVSEKGVVQIIHGRRSGDLPGWTLSAMKCLANWPRPFQALMGSEGALPNYEGFEIDVFNVVKEYFTSLTSPLTTFELFDVFVSAFIKAEAVSIQRQPPVRKFSVTPLPYLETDLDASSKPSSTSTPSGYYSASESGRDYANYLVANERTAHIRQTLQVKPLAKDFLRSSNYAGTNLNANMSPTAIMKSFLPPNSCFETAFMNENPITRIVPQKGNDILHFGTRSYRTSCQIPLSSTASVVSSASGWDSRSIATQTSDEEGEANRRLLRSRQPKWRRNARQRKSIAVMETNQETLELTNRFRSSSYSASALPPSSINSVLCGRSVDNLLGEQVSPDSDQHFLMKYQQIGDINEPVRQRRNSMVSLPSLSDTRKMSPPDNVILSKTVRKEKRRQKEKKEKSVDSRLHESPLSSTVSSSSLASCRQRFRASNQYRHVTTPTPMHICGENAPIPFMDEGMQHARAEPFNDGDGLLTVEGRRSAINSFQLLGLLLPPESRRQLQLLLKFMKRVSAKEGLRLSTSTRKTTREIVLETFSEAILRPKNDLANYDEELCRKIVCFFIENYEDIWTPPIVLRKEVEEKVYQSLVSKRIEAGEDPYPITFCKRVPSKVYEKEKVSGVQAAMLDLLEHILSDKKMGCREKRKKLKRFKLSYPDVYARKFPTTDAEPEFMRSSGAFSSSMPSLSKLRSVMRI